MTEARMTKRLLARLTLAVIHVWACSAAACVFAQSLPPRDHQHLLYYLDAAGAQQPVITPADWQLRREQILRGMQEVMGPLPPEMRQDTPAAPPPIALDVKVTASTEQEGIPRQTLSIASRNGERVTAYLWVPKDIKPGEGRAAMLALHPTGDIGKDIVAGFGKANRGYGLELAQRGYVVIAPDYVSFGDQKSHDFAADDYESGTMKAIVDHMRCVDYLQSREDVDGERIGVVGHSLGGHNSLFVAAFDTRLKAVVSSCGWDPFHHYYGGKKLANWAQERYMPRVVSRFEANPDKMPFDFYEVVAAIAPRPFFTNSPLRDSNFEYKGVKKGIRAAREVYALVGSPYNLQARYPNCEHDFPNPQRREAYAFLDAALKHKPTAVVPAANFPQPMRVAIKSTLDGTDQPCDVFVPLAVEAADSASFPLLVSLHSWSGDISQRPIELLEAAAARNWVVIQPNFRGPNDKPEACGSKLAQQDILDAVEWACRKYAIDRSRIYLCGSSGGGHMTLQMVGNHPQVWAAASAWVGISDLPAWHKLHADDRYGEMLRKCCGGAPGTSPAVDEEYRQRSPLTHLAAAKDVPLDIAAGIYDGHHGSVPVRHSVEAFNVLAKVHGKPPVDAATQDRLTVEKWWTLAPYADDEPHDPTFDRTVYFRDTAGNCRLTLFEGGHERLDAAAIEWLAGHEKDNASR